MAKFVQERDDLRVLHRTASRREIADEAGDGQLLTFNPINERKHRRVLELAIARMHIKVEPSNSHVAVEKLIGFNVFMPGLGFPRLDADVEQVLYQRQNPVT